MQTSLPSGKLTLSLERPVTGLNFSKEVGTAEDFLSIQKKLVRKHDHSAIPLGVEVSAKRKILDRISGEIGRVCRATPDISLLIALRVESTCQSSSGNLSFIAW